MTGYIQKQIIKIGKKRGFVTTEDLIKFYKKEEIRTMMNKLVALGFFEEPEDEYSFVKWRIKDEKAY